MILHKKIAVLTTTRAEFGLLKFLLKRIQSSKSLELLLFVAGNHFKEEYGSTINEIREAEISIFKEIDLTLETNSPRTLVNYSSRLSDEMAQAFEDQQPDLLFVLGDRYEILAAAYAATLFNIPIAHAHGGEVTLGAIDDQIRNAVTKLSHLHFVSHESHRKRLIQMGESSDNVYNVGAFGFEPIHNLSLLQKDELERSLEWEIPPKTALFTFHPETLKEEQTLHNLKTLLQAVNTIEGLKLIITYPNADLHGQKFIKALKDFVCENKGKHLLIPSMGQLRYLSTLQYVTFVIGNSSSGIIEAPSFKIPTVNVGDRQKGRLSSESVIHTGVEKNEIEKAIHKALSAEFQKKCKAFINPYKKDNTSKSVIKIIENANLEALQQKKFIDIL